MLCVCVYKEPSCALRSSVWCKRSHQVMAVSLPLLLVIHELPKALTLSYASLKPRNMYSILQNISDLPAQLAEWCGVSLSGLPVAIRTGHTSRCLGKNAITELALAVLLKDALTVWCDLHPRGFESIFGLVVAFFFSFMTLSTCFVKCKHLVFAALEGRVLQFNCTRLGLHTVFCLIYYQLFSMLLPPMWVWFFLVWGFFGGGLLLLFFFFSRAVCN